MNSRIRHGLASTSLLLTCSIGWAISADIAWSAPPADGEIRIERILSPYTLPESSEERWLQKRRTELERYRKMLRIAYDKVGKRDPKWDEPAREALEALARISTNQIRPMVTDSDVSIPAQKAIDAGCDDPLVLYARLRYASGKYGYDGDTTLLRWVKIADGLAKDTHPAHWRVVTLTKVATMLSNSTNPNNRVAFGKFAEAALVRYCLAFKNDRASWSSGELREVGMELQAAFTKLTGNRKTAFENFDKTLQGVPEAKATRLQLKAAYEHQTAYGARGTGAGSTVTEQGAKTMAEFLTRAKATLEEAWKADATDPWVAWVMLDVLKGIGGEKEVLGREVKLWFDRAMTADPDDRTTCEVMLDLLDPKWRGSRAELVAFGRECLKSKNVFNKIQLLVGEAHLRAVVLDPNPEAARRYLKSPAVRNEIDGAIARYFEAVPDDRGEACRIGMHFFVVGNLNESWKWFAKSEDYVRGTGVFPAEAVVSARDQVKAIMTKLGNVPRPVKHWEKLSPTKIDPDKGPDRVAAEWVVDEGGKVSFFDLKQKKQSEAKKRTDLPEGPIELIGMIVIGRRMPTEMPPLDGCKKLKQIMILRFDLRASELEHMVGISNLDLNDSTLDDAGAATIVRLSPGLSTLDIRNTQVTDEGVRSFEKLPKLIRLHLGGTKLTDRSVDSIAKLPTLYFLDISGTGISAAGFRRLIAALPKCDIYSNHGESRVKR